MNRTVLFFTMFFIALGANLSTAQDRGGVAPSGITQAMPDPATPTREIAAEFFDKDVPLALQRQDDPVPGWMVAEPQGTVGFIASTWEVTGSLGYSGRPLDVLVGIDTQGRITGAKLMHHAEPILTLGLSDADMERFVGGFAGLDLADPTGAGDGPDMPDIISRATVSTGVIRDSILRTARALAIARDVLPGSGIDRVTYTAHDWNALVDQGALTHLRVTMTEASRGLSGAKVPLSEGDGSFIELYAGIIDPPSIGRNLLGEQKYTNIMAGLGAGETALFVGSSGLYSHRGTAWQKDGVFDRLSVIQGNAQIALLKAGYTRIDKLDIAGAPELKERSIFHLPGEGFDASKPFTLALTASRPASAGGDVTYTAELGYALPAAYITDPPAAHAPLWQSRWQERRIAVGSVFVMLFVLTLILFFQESLVRRPRLWRSTRIGFLTVTLLWLGWGLNGQLSVVQVVAFVQSLFSGFRWETFLIEPVIFSLWGFVALGLLFWGRGVFCGWLCPFGALQELLNMLARISKIPQVTLPHAIHERLWVIKYTAFVTIVALSFYSMKQALILAEIEPFKTVISMRMIRAWPFVVFVLALLVAGLFIERFYCRYLCPLGAGLAIPAKLKIFDWLHRRPQCGRECRLCETKCTVGAIDTLGRINPNECVLCLRCQVVMNDPVTCPVLKRRQRQNASQ